jgi:ADP-heptose:LPS heptosyltransferase
MLFKGSQDEPVLEAIRRTLKTMPIQVDTGSNVGHFAALLQRCSLCISNDSGPRHLAVALRVPSVAFFRQHHDREWRIYLESPVSVTVQGRQPCPVCPPGACLDKIPPGERFGSYCIRMIDLDDALTCVRTLLH